MRFRVYAQNVTSEVLWCEGEKVFPGFATLLFESNDQDEADDYAYEAESRHAPDFRVAIY